MLTRRNEAMSQHKYLEIPDLDVKFPFRCFSDDGRGLVYPHWHKEIEVIYVVEGTIKIGVNDALLSVNEGEIYFFDSGETHYFLATPNSKRLVFQFDTHLFDALFQTSQHTINVRDIFKTRENWSVFWSKETETSVRQCLQACFEYAHDDDPASLYLLYAHLYEYLGLMVGKVPLKKASNKKALTNDSLQNQEVIDKMDQIFTFIEERYGEPIQLEDIADVAGFTPHYFTRFFKRNTGVTFVQFLTEYRINMAKSILGTEELPMIEVAEKAGFNSVKTFHHVFKENVGISPKKYQKLISGN